MSPFIFDADLAATELGSRRRAATTIAAANDEHIVDLFVDYRDARAAGRDDLLDLIRDHAFAVDPQLVDELDGFNYPAAA